MADENPFADLVPKKDDPFADLIPQVQQQAQPALKPDPGFGPISREAIGAADTAFNVVRQGAGILGAGVMGTVGALSGQSLEDIGEVSQKTLRVIGGEPFTQAGQENAEDLGGALNSAMSDLLQFASQIGGPQFAQRIGDIAREEGVGEGLAEVAEFTGPPGQALASVSPDIAGIASASRLGRTGPRRLPKNPDQVARAQSFEKLGAKPTRAEITRSADDFVKQQDLVKESEAVRAAIASTDDVIEGQLKNTAKATGGRTTGNSVADTVIGRSVALDDQIGVLYRDARNTVGNGRVVDIRQLNKRLTQLQASDRAMQGMPSSVRGDLQAMGIIDKKGNVLRKATLAEAEDIRVGINSHFSSTSGKGRMGIRELKNTLDNDVFSAAGKDIFESARAAKRDFEQGLNRAKISKFDSQKTNVVRDILESKVNAATLVEDVVFKKKYKARDMQQLKDYLTNDFDGVPAWKDLRAQTLDQIKEIAFAGPEIENGIRTITRAKLQRALRSIGREKLAVILEPGEAQLLDDILRVTKAREPVSGTALGSGPTGRAIQDLNRRIEQIPGFGALIHKLRIDAQGRIAIDGTVKVPINPSSPAALPAAGAVQEIRENQ